jgi:hypothetical protein
MGAVQENREIGASFNEEIDVRTIADIIRPLENRDVLAQPQDGPQFGLNGLIGKLEFLSLRSRELIL